MTTQATVTEADLAKAREAALYTADALTPRAFACLVRRIARALAETREAANDTVFGLREQLETAIKRLQHAEAEINQLGERYDALAGSRAGAEAERDALIAGWPVDTTEGPLDASTVGVVYETPDGWQAVGIEGTYATAAGAIRAAAGLASEGGEADG